MTAFETGAANADLFLERFEETNLLNYLPGIEWGYSSIQSPQQTNIIVRIRFIDEDEEHQWVFNFFDNTAAYWCESETGSSIFETTQECETHMLDFLSHRLDNSSSNASCH
jgi:hypothetical protein